MTMSESKSKLPSTFPTSATVPFPYESPYPQQTALMDTLLQCLQQKEQDDLAWRQQQQEAATSNDTPKKPRAAVMMLESPTGTGKSLSLACSAMAWLKYCEERDLTAATDTSKTTTTTTTANSKKNNDDDWWNAWVPPETKQREEELQLTQQTARDARNDLQEELALWRSKLHHNSSNSSAIHEEQRVQQRRENFVRSAVHTAKLAERSDPQRRVKQAKMLAANNNKQQREDDFCVTAYQSDSERRPQNDHDDSSDSDTDDNDKHRGRSHEMTAARSATVLLDGHRLDGSHRSHHHHAQPQQDTTTKTIGHVAAGSGVRKIVYAARTHSQLSQFCGELKRTAWGDTTRVVALGSRQLLCGHTALKKRHPTEASLTEACLDLKQGTTSKNNNDITSTSSSSSNGTKRKGSSTTKGCPLLESKEAVATLGLHLLTTPSDIEDAARLGIASHTCAYYASRKALAAAEVVVLPYSMLLSRPTRQAIGLSLQECLVIVDEAHNLPEALRQLHSSTLSLPVIQAATLQLTRYTQTYAQRLAGRNLMYLGNLRKLLLAFAKYLKRDNNNNGKKAKSGARREKENQCRQTANKAKAPHSEGTPTSKKRSLQSANEFLLDLKLGNINLFKLQRYLEQSRLAQKLLGFTRAKDKDAQDEEDNLQATGLSKHVSAMSIVQTFLEKLNLKGQEGKIVTDWPSDSDSDGSRGSRLQHPTLRYVLLQPASCFDNVLDEAHALALVGGTLAPFGHVAAELLAGDDLHKKTNTNMNHQIAAKSLLQMAVQADRNFQEQPKSLNKTSNTGASGSSLSIVSSRFAAFTCDHVIHKSRVFLKCLSFGPNRQKFDFRHQSRMASALCQDLGQALLQLCQAVPNGLVVFLPSYSYEAHLVRQWQQSGIWDQLNRRKKVFREPKGAEHMESTLRLYAKHAAEGGNTNGKEDKSNGGRGRNGALLLSVIGGKMSEGINLSNSMARGVVVVGLPYPDITDPILVEKMTNLDQSGVGGITGQAYYQNLCMRAVNQSVGRAIRHANDYAAIVLCDYRYGTQSNIWEALPKWLRHAPSSPRDNSRGFAAMASELEAFFKRMECS